MNRKTEIQNLVLSTIPYYENLHLDSKIKYPHNLKQDFLYATKGELKYKFI